MSIPIAFIFLLLLASVVAMLARRWKIPYTVALVVTGLSISVFREQFYPEVDLGLHLTPELLFVILLPILIYEAAFHFDLREFGIPSFWEMKSMSTSSNSFEITMVF